MLEFVFVPEARVSTRPCTYTMIRCRRLEDSPESVDDLCRVAETSEMTSEIPLGLRYWSTETWERRLSGSIGPRCGDGRAATRLEIVVKMDCGIVDCGVVKMKHRGCSVSRPLAALLGCCTCCELFSKCCEMSLEDNYALISQPSLSWLLVDTTYRAN